jgi:PAS domain S-box-containing protein
VTEVNRVGSEARPQASISLRDKDAFRLLVESTLDYGIFMLDPAGYVTTWNAGAARIKGYSADEIIGKHFSIFYPAEAIERKWPAKELEMATAEGRFEDEGWRLRKDGTRFWANVIITALRDEAGRLIGFGKVSRDLSNRRRAEQSLRDSEERFRLIVESTVDYAIFMLDPDGYIASWNAGAERIKGYSAEEIIGQHFSKFYTAEANATGWPAFELQEAIRVGRFEDEGWRVRKDGSTFWANVVITAIRGADATLRGFAKVTRDLTQRKAHEERISRLTTELQRRVADLDMANRELAQRNAENESFVYSVSHDLRAPLVNLQGFSQELALSGESLARLLDDPGIPQTIRDEARTLLDGEIQESISFVRNSVRHLGSIVDGLLRLSRVGRIEYESVPVDTGAVLGEMLASMRSTIDTVRATIEVGPMPTVNGDRNAIGQIFANIIGNALKNFDDARPGRISVSASSATPAVFAVRDNGVGISPEYQSKIFQVFQHVHRTRNPGEGMGLAIVRRIVEKHGGRIWFESAPDVGTTFYFTLEPDRGQPPPETSV